jgi:hypothetical protein
MKSLILFAFAFASFAAGAVDSINSVVGGDYLKLKSGEVVQIAMGRSDLFPASTTDSRILKDSDLASATMLKAEPTSNLLVARTPAPIVENSSFRPSPIAEISAITKVITDPSTHEVIGYDFGYSFGPVRFKSTKELPSTKFSIMSPDSLADYLRNDLPQDYLVHMEGRTARFLLAKRNLPDLVKLVKAMQSRPNYNETYFAKVLAGFLSESLAQMKEPLPEIAELRKLLDNPPGSEKLNAASEIKSRDLIEKSVLEGARR